MRKLFVTAIMLGLFAVTPAAFAQGGQNQSDRADKGAKSDQGDKSGKSGQSDQGNKSGNAKGQNESRTQGDVRNAPTMRTRNAVTTDRKRNVRNTDRTRNVVNTDRTRNVGNTDRTPDVGTHGRTRSTATTGRSVDFKSLRGNVRSSHRFHAGTYNRPHGYHYRHWRYGQRLPSFYFVRDYWIMDYLMYSLFAPPDGYVWVRVGDDALLIDEYTGEIVRVEYGVFY